MKFPEDNKLTPEFLKEQIAQINYTLLTDRLTHCILTLENGFTVTGESVCVDVKNFDKTIGEEIAYAQAFGKLWELYGFLLKQQLHEAPKNFIERLDDEIKQLSDKIEKLLVFLDKRPVSIPEDDASKLLKQLEIMHDYQNILLERRKLL